jgi:hypothetical protein
MLIPRATSTEAPDAQIESVGTSQFHYDGLSARAQETLPIFDEEENLPSAVLAQAVIASLNEVNEPMDTAPQVPAVPGHVDERPVTPEQEAGTISDSSIHRPMDPKQAPSTNLNNEMTRPAVPAHDRPTAPPIPIPLYPHIRITSQTSLPHRPNTAPALQFAALAGDVQSRRAASEQEFDIASNTVESRTVAHQHSIGYEENRPELPEQDVPTVPENDMTSPLASATNLPAMQLDNASITQPVSAAHLYAQQRDNAPIGPPAYASQLPTTQLDNQTIRQPSPAVHLPAIQLDNQTIRPPMSTTNYHPLQTMPTLSNANDLATGHLQHRPESRLERIALLKKKHALEMENNNIEKRNNDIDKRNNIIRMQDIELDMEEAEIIEDKRAFDAIVDRALR